MKILFVNPHYPHDPYTLLLHPPLCYAYMATHLKAAGHDVRHADLPFLGNTVSALGPVIDDFQPDIVGVTSVAQSYAQALEIARAVKESNRSPLVVFGGPHVTFIADECLSRHPAVDFVLAYDSEESMVDLCAALAGGRYGFSSVFFGDDTFSGNPTRAIAICDEIRLRGLELPWTSNMRAQDARPKVLEATFRLRLIRPDRRDEAPRHGSIGWIRQWIESVNDTLKGQLDLERHGGRTTGGLYARITQRLLAMAAAIWHNWATSAPAKRSLITYDN